ncbi:hypothetical protein D9M73_261910 [compost metagenome]
MRVGIEPADGQVGAGEQSQFEAGHLTDWQGARAADRRDAAVGGDEAVPVRGARLQAVDGELGGPVAVGTGAHGAAADHAGELGVQRHLCLQADFVGAAGWDVARP